MLNLESLPQKWPATMWLTEAETLRDSLSSVERISCRWWSHPLFGRGQWSQFCQPSRCSLLGRQLEDHILFGQDYQLIKNKDVKLCCVTYIYYPDQCMTPLWVWWCSWAWPPWRAPPGCQSLTLTPLPWHCPDSTGEGHFVLAFSLSPRLAELRWISFKTMIDQFGGKY